MNGFRCRWPPFAGLVGGLIRQAMPNTEDIWNFGPFTFLSIPRWLVRLIRAAQSVPWEMLPLAGCVAAGTWAGWRWAMPPSRNGFFISTRGNWWSVALVLLATVMAVAVPIKIWNNTRIEMNLEQHQQLLLKARMDALSAQINPHFLFNTLNTVSSLIRYDPDLARGVVLKLSNILRRLLRKHETFVPLQEELDFIDDYLDIEVARFGRDNLQIFKQMDEAHARRFCSEHAAAAHRGKLAQARLAAKLEGGQITIRTATRRRPAGHRSGRQRRGNSQKTAWRRFTWMESASATCTSACACSTATISGWISPAAKARARGFASKCRSWSRRCRTRESDAESRAKLQGC